MTMTVCGNELTKVRDDENDDGDDDDDEAVTTKMCFRGVRISGECSVFVPGGGGGWLLYPLKVLDQFGLGHPDCHSGSIREGKSSSIFKFAWGPSFLHCAFSRHTLMERLRF